MAVPKQVTSMAANSSNATTATRKTKINAKTAPELVTRTTVGTSKATKTSPVPRLLSAVSPKLAATMTLTMVVSTRKPRTIGATLRNLLTEDTLAMALKKTTLRKLSKGLVSQISVRGPLRKKLHRLLSQAMVVLLKLSAISTSSSLVRALWCTSTCLISMAWKFGTPVWSTRS
jgi:hypothetical protein